MTNKIKIFHSVDQPWQFIDKNRIACIMLRIQRDIAERINCINCDPCDTYVGSGGDNLPRLISDKMELYFSHCNYDYYVFKKPMTTRKLRYHFQIKIAGKTWIYDETGISQEKREFLIRPFFVNYIFGSTLYNAPEWASKTVWYQVFPDRFCKGNENLSTDNFNAWAYTPVTDKDARYGGDFAGIKKKIEYLRDLEITGIYLNPIFAAYSNHKYDAIDYYRVDPHFGTEADFIELCDAFHQANIRVMLDGVFNHCSHMTPQFQDVLKKGRCSRYYDWFLIHDEQKLLQSSIINDSCESFKTEPIYETFAFVPSMPKWNTENPKVIEHLIGAAEYWTKRCQIDAWRLDVPDEISPEFLRCFRRRIKAINSDIYIIGEIWSKDNRWLQGDMFDGVMNYTLYFIVRDFVANCSIDAYVFADRIAQYILEYPDAIRNSMFNFCGNHDVPRILTISGGDQARARLCYVITSIMRGGLSIYYGDEIPLQGGFDPDNRRCIPWNNISIWDAPFTDSIKKLIEFKKYEAGDGCRNLCALDSDTIKISIKGTRMISLYVTRSETEKKIELISSNLVILLGDGIIRKQNLILPPNGYAFIEEN